MDLKTPLVSAEKRHPNFDALLVPGHFDREWETLHSWASGFKDRDGKFVKEFQTSFNSSFWELYLNAAFQELGFSHDYSHSRPDFHLSQGQKQFVAEATIASNADGYRPEWEADFESYSDFDKEVVLSYASIRLANSIFSKYKKYKEEYSKLSHVSGKPFVICVAPFEQPGFFAQNDGGIRRVLYGYDQPLWIPDSDGTPSVVGEALFPSIKKENGTELQLGFFTSKMMQEVSAVIFSTTATVSKVRALTKNSQSNMLFFAQRYDDNSPISRTILEPSSSYAETLLDGLHLCINPFAEIELDFQPFMNREITIHDYDPNTGEYFTLAPDGFLIQRVSIIQATGNEKDMLADIAKKQYKTPVKDIWLEGHLYQFSGNVGHTTDVHLAHFKGWTICVARDTIDNDWSSIAIQGKYTTLATFQSTPKHNYLQLPDFMTTKEEAFGAMQELILRQIVLDEP